MLQAGHRLRDTAGHTHQHHQTGEMRTLQEERGKMSDRCMDWCRLGLGDCLRLLGYGVACLGFANTGGLSPNVMIITWIRLSTSEMLCNKGRGSQT